MNSAQPPTSSMAVVRIMPMKKMATALMLPLSGIGIRLTL